MNKVLKINNKGFTLIELLVVIAIIGILAAIVLASLGPARNKAKNVRLKGELSQLRSTAELYYDNNDLTYGASATSSCDTGNSVTNFLKGSKIMIALKSQIPGSGNVVCNINKGAYVVSIPLFDDDSNDAFWCADSNGYIGAVAAQPSASVYTCN